MLLSNGASNATVSSDVVVENLVPTKVKTFTTDKGNESIFIIYTELNVNSEVCFIYICLVVFE